jgi:hypothetical protein
MWRRWTLVGVGLAVFAAVAGTWRLHAIDGQSHRITSKGSSPTVASVPASQTSNADPPASHAEPIIDPHEARKKATDYRQLVKQLLPLANSGSLAAQFEISDALNYCSKNSHLLVSRTTGTVRTPEEIHELDAKLPANTQSLVEAAYQRCRSFVGDQNLLETSSAWLDQAAKAGYSPAVFMQAQQKMQSHLVDGNSAALQEARQQAVIASISGDPGVLFGMSNFVDGDGKPREQAAKLVSAWWLLGCETGYDCSPESEAIKGICTVDAQCANKPSVVEEIQRINGANFVEVEQLATQIKAALDSRDPEQIKKFL